MAQGKKDEAEEIKKQVAKDAEKLANLEEKQKEYEEFQYQKNKLLM